jgi:RNA polymerase sigma-70 factor (ECF subfamily)
MPDTDCHLVARIRRRDAAAWEELIARFEGRLLAFVDSRLGNRATAEDVVQETFLGFLTSLPNYDESTPLETFLFSIAAYKLTDVLRREGRRPALSLVVADRVGPHGPDEPAAKSRRASSLYRSQEQRGAEEQVIGDCLSRLIETWQAAGEFERLKCLEMLFVLGRPNKDVAARLGISEQAVANHKHFVVAKLKEAAVAARLRDFDLSDFGVLA